LQPGTRLKREGYCFKCEVRGYLSRDCPGEEEEEVFESNDIKVRGISEEEPSKEEAETQSSVDDGEISADDANNFESQNTKSEEDSNDEFRRVVQIIRVFERGVERLQNIESTLLWLGAEKIDPVRELCGTVIRCGGEF
jgi:hypothetical protein